MSVVIVNKLNDDLLGLSSQFLGTFNSNGLSLDFNRA